MSVYYYLTSSYNLNFSNLNFLETGASDFGLDTKEFRLTNNCYYIEPIKESYYNLLKQSNIIKENVFNYAVHDYCGKTEFMLTSHGGNSSYNHSIEHMNELIHVHKSNFTKITVDTITYKSFIEDCINKNIDILILDVEGCEEIILNSFKNLNIDQLPKIICIECGYSWIERKKLLLELGYKIDFYGFNNCYLSFGDIKKNTVNIQKHNLSNKQFNWCDKTIYINELL